MRTAFEALGGWGQVGNLSAGFETDDEHPNDGGERPRFRAVFISDLHLGTAGCQASALLEFLKHHPSQTLYLVGDIIDGWQLRRKWFWPQAHNEVSNEAVHTTADGQRLWVVHGDHFDGVIQCAKWLAYVGDNLYEFTLRLNRHLNSLRARMGLPYWSLSQYLKHKVKSALNYVTDFERAVAAEARHKGYQGVVCGHIHRPEMRHIDGTLYCNDGDWVESLSALVEHMDGRLELVHWIPSIAERPSEPQLRQTA